MASDSKFRNYALPILLRALRQLKGLLRNSLLSRYEERLAHSVQGGKIPRHLGLILDGNRRFARASGLETELGHEFGAEKAHEVLSWCLELGIPSATIWVLSTDNSSRDPKELNHLMHLLGKEARQLAVDPRIHNNQVRVKAIGQHSQFPAEVLTALQDLEAKTAHYKGMRLNIAVGYGGREEIVDAVKSHLKASVAAGCTLQQVTEQLSPEHISSYLYAADQPDPDFIIRTSGEVRLSGFMLWQSVYSEYYFCDVFWPSFRRVDFLRALRDFQGRERRFGK